MCILSYLPSGVLADTDGLLNGGISNGDGHGWAIVLEDGRILIGKHLRITDAVDTFAELRDKYPSGPAMFHSRWATHGSIHTGNVHPFVVGGHAIERVDIKHATYEDKDGEQWTEVDRELFVAYKRTVVGHNGILPGDAHPGPGDDRSDTKLFAEEILSTRFRRLDKPSAFKAMGAWAGTNKLLILTTEDRYSQQAYLVNEKQGHWDSLTGIWHSNYDYLSPGRWAGSYGYGTGSYWTSPANYAYKSAAESAEVFAGTDEGGAFESEQCYICQMGYTNRFGYCTECGSCIDCCEHERDCQCYARGEHLTDAEREELDSLIGRDHDDDLAAADAARAAMAAETDAADAEADAEADAVLSRLSRAALKLATKAMGASN